MTKEEIMDLWIAMCNSKKTVKSTNYINHTNEIKLPNMCSISLGSDFIAGLGVYYDLERNEEKELRYAYDAKVNEAGYTAEEIKALL